MADPNPECSDQGMETESTVYSYLSFVKDKEETRSVVFISEVEKPMKNLTIRSIIRESGTMFLAKKRDRLGNDNETCLRGM